MIAWLAAAALAAPTLDADRIAADVEALAGGSVSTSRNIHHPGNAAAVDWLVSRFGEIDGLVVREEVFEADGVSGLVNVIADLPGDDPDAPWVVISAHIDTTGKADEGYDPATDPAPGADDDASGIAAMLEIARVLSPTRHQSTVRFIAFNAEEEGLLGSFFHTGQLKGQPIRLVLNLDPIGFNPGDTYTLWITYDARWPDDALALEALAPQVADTLTVTAIDAALLGGDRRSDHAPFWDEGYAALHLASFPQPAEYHTANDTVDVVDPQYTTAVATLVAAHAEDLAVPMATTDAPSGCGCRTGSPTGSMWAWVLLVGLRWRKNFIAPCQLR